MKEYPNFNNLRPTKYDCIAEPFIKWEVDREKAFDCLQKRAEYCKGIVMPDLDTTIINIVEVKPHNFNSNDPLGEAKTWAEKNLVGIYKAHEDTYDEFEYQISKSVIRKYLQPSATEKSDNIYVHLSALKELPSIIEESIDTEIHADYTKINGIRSNKNPINDKILIHRFYGVIRLDKSLYRIKLTIQEYKQNNVYNKPYTFEVIKIELLDIKESNSSNFDTEVADSIETDQLPIANILQNVEKSYDKGKFLLEETKKHAEIVAEFCKFYFSKEKHNKKP